MMGLEASSIHHNLVAVRDRIAAAAGRAGRNPDEITLVTVTKSFPVAMVAAALEAGAGVLGENRTREAAEKYGVLGGAIDGRRIFWHFIGYLQTNKVKQIIGFTDLIHSVDRIELAQAIDKRARAAGKIQPVLLEVNIAGETAKSGAAPSDVADLAAQAGGLPNLRIDGLMTMAPLGDDPESARPVFARLRALRDDVKDNILPGCEQLSMGMTDDFEVAVEEGATIVRIGRAIMGPRPLA